MARPNSSTAWLMRLISSGAVPPGSRAPAVSAIASIRPVSARKGAMMRLRMALNDPGFEQLIRLTKEGAA